MLQRVCDKAVNNTLASSSMRLAPGTMACLRAAAGQGPLITAHNRRHNAVRFCTLSTQVSGHAYETLKQLLHLWSGLSYSLRGVRLPF